MRTVKLVLVGPSGVGKTALRSKVNSNPAAADYPADPACSTSRVAFSAVIERQSGLTLFQKLCHIQQIRMTRSRYRFGSIHVQFLLALLAKFLNRTLLDKSAFLLYQMHSSAARTLRFSCSTSTGLIRWSSSLNGGTNSVHTLR
jgi:GTPase SAR1 family protein